LRIVLAAALLGAVVGLVASGSGAPFWLIVILLALLAGVAFLPLARNRPPDTQLLAEGRKSRGSTSPRMRDVGAPSRVPSDEELEPIVAQRGPTLEPVSTDERGSSAKSAKPARPAKSAKPARPAKSAKLPAQTFGVAAEHDWERLSAVCAAVPPTTVRWLRSQDFEAPWLDERVRPFVDIVPDVAELVRRPFPSAIAEALLLLAVALDQFVVPYERYTVRDPFVPYEDWRFYGWDGDPNGAMDAELLTAPSQLAELSTRVADAFDSLLEATAGYQSVPHSDTA
jgi:hypothetical protein